MIRGDALKAGVLKEAAIGPHIGPAGNLSGLPDGAKWLLSFGMLLGRLELFTVLLVFVPQFWCG